MNIALTISCDHSLESLSNWDNPINPKISAIFAEYQRLNLDKNKNDRFLCHRKTTKIMFLPSVFFYWNHHLQTQKSTFTAKFSPSPSFRSDFICSYSLLGRATASHSSAYRPCLDFQHHHCIACWEIARIFGSICSFPHIFYIYTKSTATLTYHRNFLLVVFFSGRKFQNMPW